MDDYKEYFEIKNKAGAVIYSGEYETIKDCISDAITNYQSLAGALFEGQDLSHLNLFNGALNGAVFNNCDLSNSHFSGSHMSGIEFVDCNLDYSKFENCWLWNATVYESKANHVSFKDCALNDVSFSHTDLQNTKFIDSRMHNSSFKSIDFNNGNFNNCDLKKSKFQGGDFQNAKFIYSDLGLSNFDKCRLGDAEFKQCDFKDINFKECSLGDAAFEGFDVDKKCFNNCKGNVLCYYEFDNENLPQEVKDIISKHESDSHDYSSCLELFNDLNTVGWSCDYYLDAEPFGLHKIEAGGFEFDLEKLSLDSMISIDSPLNEIEIPKEFMGYEFSKEEIKTLESKGELIEAIIIEKDGKEIEGFISVDADKKELFFLVKEDILIDFKVFKGNDIPKEKLQALVDGYSILIRDFDVDGKKSNVQIEIDKKSGDVKISDIKSGLSLLSSNTTKQLENTQANVESKKVDRSPKLR